MLRAVAAGESFVITNDGDPVARVLPIDTPVPGLPCTRPARSRGGFGELTRYQLDETVREALDDLRGER